MKQSSELLELTWGNNDCMYMQHKHQPSMLPGQPSFTSKGTMPIWLATLSEVQFKAGYWAYYLSGRGNYFALPG